MMKNAKNIDKSINSQKNNEKNVEKKSTIKIVKNIIEYIIIFVIILVNAILVIKSINNPNKTPDIFGKKAFVIISGSMIPKIQVGDIVIVNNTNNAKINDIIAFKRGSTVIVHRIIKEMDVSGKLMYQTKGDNNNIPDTELVDISEIEGVYIGKIPFIGKILMFMYNNLSIIVVLIVVILIIKYFI